MENLLRFPPGKHRQIVRHIRRNPQIAPQLYFVTTKPYEGGRILATFEQATFDKNRNQITSYVFLEHLVATRSAESLHCAIDEKNQLIYIVYEDIRKNLATEGLHFTYEKPDKFGYRRVCVPNRISVERNGIVFQETRFSLTALNICPSTAKLILHCKTIDTRSELTQLGFWNHLQDIYAARRAPPNVKVTLLRPHQALEMEARSHVFSRSNDVLDLISYHDRNPPANEMEQEFRNAMRMVMPDGFMILYSYDAQMQAINTLQIEPVRLLQNFLPRSLLDGLKTGAPALMPDFMYFGAHLQLLGHVHKYVLFFFHHNYVLAAKWPKNWYKLQQVPEMQQKKVICVDKQRNHGEIRDVWLVSNDLYFKVELRGVEAVRKMNLSHKFKDYHCCAFCGKEEKRKRKNKQGKRISSFKVCRMCKKLNLHKCYTDGSVKCHYCSFECQRKHWKQHKPAHSPAGNQRK